MDADGSEERVEVGVKILRINPEIPVQEEEELLFHEIDFGEGETKGIIALDGGVAGPVLVLGRRVVQVFSGENEGGKEDAVDGAAHAFRHRGQALLQPREVDEGAHQGRDLDMGAVDQGLDENFQCGEGGLER